MTPSATWGGLAGTTTWLAVDVRSGSSGMNTPDNIADDLIDRSVRRHLFDTLDTWTG